MTSWTRTWPGPPGEHANHNRLGCCSFGALPPRESLRPLREPAAVHPDEDDKGAGESCCVGARIRLGRGTGGGVEYRVVMNEHRSCRCGCAFGV